MSWNESPSGGTRDWRRCVTARYCLTACASTSVRYWASCGGGGAGDGAGARANLLVWA